MDPQLLGQKHKGNESLLGIRNVWSLSRFREFWAFWDLGICGYRWCLRNSKVGKGGTKLMSWKRQIRLLVLSVPFQGSQGPSVFSRHSRQLQ